MHGFLKGFFSCPEFTNLKFFFLFLQTSEEGIGSSSYMCVSVIKHHDQGSLKKNLFGVIKLDKNPSWWEHGSKWQAQ